MRKIIVIIISLILISLGIVFVNKINDKINDDLIKVDGDIKFEVESIKTETTPVDKVKLINSFTELNSIKNNPDFSSKSSYIYMRIDTDNKNKYQVTNVSKLGTTVLVTVTKTANEVSSEIETIPGIHEYIIKTEGVLDSKSTIDIKIVN